MSMPSKSKTKDKKAGKEQKASSKVSGTVSATSGIPTSAYNPILGTFHTLETSSTAPSLQINGRFKNIDDSDDHSGSTNGSGGDYDSASNNDNRSVESEEQKTNVPIKQEVIPGADNDKREKVRQKNERKHQRQKEKRAQELHERCCGFLMSRKLESLAQQLVGMGFSLEQSTMALMLNEGRVEEAVAWLFEVGEDADKQTDQSVDTSGNLKIDISQELARIAELEIKFKCSKQDVERALVACEGDLDKAEETLKSQKQEPPSAMQKYEEASDSPSLSSGMKILVMTSNQSPVRPHLKPGSTSILQQRRDERDFNYTKAAVTVGPALKTVSKIAQPVTIIQQRKLELLRPQQSRTPTIEKQWPGGGSTPSPSHPLASPLQVSPPAKAETRHAPEIGEYKPIQPGIVRERVIMMQRPQSVNANQAPVSNISSSPPGISMGWRSSNPEIMKPNGLLPHISSTRSSGLNDLGSNHFYHRRIYPQDQPSNIGGGPVNVPATTRGNSSWRAGSSPPLTATSLGLYPSRGATCSSGLISPVDWNTNGSVPCDYTSIDWSINRSVQAPKQNGQWLGLGSFQKSNTHLYDSNQPVMGGKPTMRPLSPNGNGVSLVGLQDGLAGMPDTSPAVSCDWTSPFEGKDLFSLPRQFVFSPSL